MTPAVPPEAQAALAGARPTPFWLDDPTRPERLEPLRGDTASDLAVVGGGYTGLWTALLAKERDPGRDVVVLEAADCGGEASGRNGGFCAASLTHGFSNGMARWPREMSTLTRLGRDNLAAIERTVHRFGIDCGFEHTGELDVATAPHQAAELSELSKEMNAEGHQVRYLDEFAVQDEVASPTYLAGLHNPDVALVEPARLAWGLRRACLELDVGIFEGSGVSRLSQEGKGRIAAHTEHGRVRAERVVLATNAAPSLLRRLRLYTVPVYDYALTTEPLDGEQMASVRWRGRQGVGDSANLFHYYRLTRDNRILWGGYDAIYPYRSRISRDREQRAATFTALSRNFFTTFPQLTGLRFSHRWGGVIDTCTRFCAFYGTAHGGRVAYALGFTGLGVGASRFAADVMLDLLEGAGTERTELTMVRERPWPFPPEPFRYLGIELTRRSLARADSSGGRRNLWLRTLDRFGLGFDS